METTPATTTPAPIIISAPEGAANTAIKYGIGAIVLGAAIWKARSMYMEAQANNEADKSTTDANSNAAEQLHEVIDTSWGAKFLGTKDSSVLTILAQVTDIEAVKTKYKTITQGSDLIEDMRKGMKGANFTKAMNMLGVKSGIIKPVSATGIKASNQTKAMFAVAKVDARVRKTPVLTSTFNIFNNNVIGVAKTGFVAGITTGAKPVMDTTNNVFFLPIKVILSDNTTANAFVAVSNVDLFEKRPDDNKIFSVAKSDYDKASSPVEGLSGDAPISKLLI